jgi:hypothetical protein
VQSSPRGLIVIQVIARQLEIRDSETEAEAPAQLSVCNCDGNVAALERVSVSSARCTLGVKLALGGNKQAQPQKLLDTAQLEGTDTGRTSSTATRLGVEYNNDFTYV